MRRFVSLLVLLSISVALFSQSYVSVKLQDIATQVNLRDDFNYPLNIIKNKAGKVSHIGFNLFAEKLKTDYPSPIYHFIERYLLELYLMEDATLMTRMLTEDKVQIQGQRTIREQINRLLTTNKDNLSLSISQDDKNYTVSVTENQQTLLVMTFPVQYELLLGGNKKEIEATFYEGLLYSKEYVDMTNVILPVEEGKLLVDMGDNIFRKVGMTYIIDSMNSDSFYHRLSDGTYEPVVDDKHLEASVRNLILLPGKHTINVEVTQMLYGYKKITFESTLNKFLSYCKNEGCTTYVGIEEITNENISGTIILHNHVYGYCHQAYFSVNPKIILNPKADTMKLTLYAYVPTHNIQTLFQEHINLKVK